MTRLLVVGGGLFGSQAAAYARSQGIETLVFDARLEGAASPCAAGLFKEAWAGKKWHDHYRHALPILDKLYGLRRVSLTHHDGAEESFHFVPPAVILEREPIREAVTAVGDGWLQTSQQRYEGWVYIAAGVWCERFHPGLDIVGKAGAALTFAGESAGRIRQLGRGRQAIAFVRDAGFTHFSDGTAEKNYTPEHERQTLARAAEFGLRDPTRRLWGLRPYTPGGPLFRQIGNRTWLATGGRKLGTILGASFARRLVDEFLRTP